MLEPLMTISLVVCAGFAGWLYGRAQGQHIEDGLRFDIEEMDSRCQALKRRLRVLEIGHEE